jgi:hypothetical protein
LAATAVGRMSFCIGVVLLVEPRRGRVGPSGTMCAQVPSLVPSGQGDGEPPGKVWFQYQGGAVPIRDGHPRSGRGGGPLARTGEAGAAQRAAGGETHLVREVKFT